MKKYLNRAIKIAKFLEICPFVRAVFLTGSVARGEAKDKSDIDFFIVTKKGRIWISRTFVTIFVALTGYRRHGDHIAGRICLNRYQTEDNLDIKPHNNYHAFDYSKMKPLWETNGIYSKYLEENTWITQKLGHAFKITKPLIETSNTLLIIRSILEMIFDSNWLEGQLKTYQCRRILSDPRTLNSPEGKVFISDRELRFHPVKEEKLS